MPRPEGLVDNPELPAVAGRPTASVIEQALIGGDLSRLNPDQRVSYYNQVCESLDLNPLTKPFAYITLNGKLTLYALKDCTEQLRSKRNISVQIVGREVTEGIYVVTARASTPSGRCDESIGAVPLGQAKGENLANAIMKAETKAKRRVTLSICGLGILDETEVASIPSAHVFVEAPVAPALPPATETPGPSEGVPETVSEPKTGGPSATSELFITKIAQNLITDDIVEYIITLSSGREIKTRKEQMATLAAELCQNREPIELELGPRGGFAGFKRVHRPEPEPAAAMLTADDLKF